MLEENAKLLTIQDAAELLNVKISRMRAMIFKNEIPFFKLGRLIRFDKDDLLIWVEEKKNYQ